MRSSKRVLGSFVLGLITFGALAHGCGKDPDTPTPTQKVYPRDEIDAVPSNGTIVLAEMREPVRVVRDKRGMVHIYARNLHDAALAEGYFMAQDRAPQLEILRRVAEGRLAELFGKLQPSLGSRDITMRAMGLRRWAEKYYATLKEGSDGKDVVDGFAKGVTQFFRKIRERDPSIAVPNGWLAIRPERYTDWDAVATLTIGKLQTWGLSYTGDDEIDFTELLQKAQDTFKEGASDPALAARKGFMIDALRFEPAAKRPVIDTPPPAAPSFMDLKPEPKLPIVPPPRLEPKLLAEVRPVLDAMKETREILGKGGWSSNNWVVAPSRSATGQVMVASDPHLGLPAPSIFYMTSLHVLSSDPNKQLDVAGVSFAGIPGVVLGFNKHIAWGATVAVFDVNDVYRDKIVDGKVDIKKPDGTLEKVAVEVIKEQIDYGDGRKLDIEIETIPGHGVVLPTVENDRWVKRSSSEVLSVRWTGMDLTGELQAFLNLNRAKNVDEAVTAMEPFAAGAQNFVFGDSSGNIRYTTHSHVPVRPKGALAWDGKTYKGQLPCLVFPGDAGLEWTGRVSDAQLPNAKNPPNGYIATANSDQYGLLFDNDPTNDPLFLSCVWDMGFRQHRVRELLDAKEKLTLEDMARIQGDAKSPLGTNLSPFFVEALEKAEAARLAGKPSEYDVVLKDPRWDTARMQFVLAALKAWKDKGDFATPAAVPVGSDPLPSSDEVTASQATLIFNAAMVPLFKRVFDDERKAMGNPPWWKDLQVKTLLRMLKKPEPLATADASGESILWDDLDTKDVVETKDQQLLLSLLDGLEWIVKTYGPNPDKWRWGSAHTITFNSMLPGTERQLSIPELDDGFPEGGFPRQGDEHVIDRSDYGLGGSNYQFKFSYSSGPAQRFVAALDAKGPLVRNALPGGNVWKPGDRWFDNDAELWRKNQNAKVAFSPGEVVPEAAERWDLVPF